MSKPRDIVIVSAHWEWAPLAITGTAAGTPLHYDFGGFHPRYYSLQYPTPDASELAREVGGVLGVGTELHERTNRGLDHGAFIPLMAMYPAGDVPVVLLSMPSQKPADLLALGTRLRRLREDGVLVIGSGYMTHSFDVFRDSSLARPLAEFDAWAADALARGDVDSLVDYRRKAPDSLTAHPSAEHFVPLLATLGAADDVSSVQTVIERTALGNSIRSVEVA